MAQRTTGPFACADNDTQCMSCEPDASSHWSRGGGPCFWWKLNSGISGTQNILESRILAEVTRRCFPWFVAVVFGFLMSSSQIIGWFSLHLLGERVTGSLATSPSRSFFPFLNFVLSCFQLLVKKCLDDGDACPVIQAVSVIRWHKCPAGIVVGHPVESCESHKRFRQRGSSWKLEPARTLLVFRLYLAKQFCIMGVSYEANRKQLEFLKYSKIFPPHTQKSKTATRPL